MAAISIEGMEFFAYHGRYNDEHIIGNKYIVDFYFETDTKGAEKSDDIRQTVNYQSVYKVIKKEMKLNSKLIEHVAKRIIDAVCKEFPHIKEANIKISKLNPQLGGKADKVSVTVSRQ